LWPAVEQSRDRLFRTVRLSLEPGVDEVNQKSEMRHYQERQQAPGYGVNRGFIQAEEIILR